MKKMTIEEIHGVNLEILKHIHQYCLQNGYRYNIGWGTLIGAVRHGGFIPWDDDSDIMMPRPDYDRFIKEYEDSSKYRLYAPQRRNSGLAYARLCEMEDTYFGQVNPWTKENPGVGVDIFPIDSLSDDHDQFFNDTEKLAQMRNDTFRIRSQTKFFRWEISRRLSIIRNLKNLIHNILSIPLGFSAWRRLYRLLDIMDTLMRQYPEVDIATDYESAFDHYGVSSVPELTQKIRSIPSFRGIEAPYCLDGENLYVPDLASRYFTEDVAYGTVRIQRLARQARVATPTIDMFVERTGNLVKGGK